MTDGSNKQQNESSDVAEEQKSGQHEQNPKDVSQKRPPKPGPDVEQGEEEHEEQDGQQRAS